MQRVHGLPVQNVSIVSFSGMGTLETLDSKTHKYRENETYSTCMATLTPPPLVTYLLHVLAACASRNSLQIDPIMRAPARVRHISRICDVVRSRWLALAGEKSGLEIL